MLVATKERRLCDTYHSRDDKTLLVKKRTREADGRGSAETSQFVP